jgi:hypothetical protein
MKEEYRLEIPQADARLNLAPAFGDAIKAFVAPLIQAALAKEDRPMPMPAPIGGKTGRGDPPLGVEPAEDRTRPTPKIDQIEDSKQSITEVPEDGKPSPRPSIAPPGLDPADCVECSVGLYLRLFDEPETPEIGYAHFDFDPKFCSALITELNRGNRKLKTFLTRSHVESVAYCCAKRITELLLRTPQTPAVTAVRAVVVTVVGKAPNQRVAESKLAVALAQSDLLSRVSLVPIYGDAPVIGRSFALAQLKIYIPTQDLGKPWNQKSV